MADVDDIYDALGIEPNEEQSKKIVNIIRIIRQEEFTAGHEEGYSQGYSDGNINSLD
jgi:flagellar biosynthesis/type III secretory pathway protein FliH